MYRRDTTGGENWVGTLIEAALEYNKHEERRFRVSVEMIQAVRLRDRPKDFNK